MTREDKIKKQADIYTDDASNYAEYSNDGGWSDTNDIELVEKAFIEGAEWADANPKSPWISVDDDLPCNHKKLINGSSTVEVFAACKNGYFSSTYMIKGLKKWRWNDFEPDYWIIPPKLPKE